ncbi:cytochrome c [Aquabacterium sp. G14]|uniref:c-type cytochrome n=1 Tax=Aquabacterium sp. G14 TaxID=3130164 RepID=UPI00309E63F7
MNHLPPSSPQQREHEEPHEHNGALPGYVAGLVIALMLFGIVYLWRTTISAPPEWGDGRTAEELQGPSGDSAGSVDGSAIFSARCAACHQATGAGLPGVFPPLAGSEWVQGDSQTLAAAVLHGINGQLTVKGQVYAGVMPGFAAQLSDAELSAVLTHIRKSWGNHAAPISIDLVARVRKATTTRAESYRGDAELHQLKLAP